jgi:hypothetical protein
VLFVFFVTKILQPNPPHSAGGRLPFVWFVWFVDAFPFGPTPPIRTPSA